MNGNTIMWNICAICKRVTWKVLRYIRKVLKQHLSIGVRLLYTNIYHVVSPPYVKDLQFLMSANEL